MQTLHILILKILIPLTQNWLRVIARKSCSILLNIPSNGFYHFILNICKHCMSNTFGNVPSKTHVLFYIYYTSQNKEPALNRQNF